MAGVGGTKSGRQKYVTYQAFVLCVKGHWAIILRRLGLKVTTNFVLRYLSSIWYYLLPQLATVVGVRHSNLGGRGTERQVLGYSF